MKRRDPIISLITVETCKPRVSCIIDPKKEKSSDHLFRVTAALLMFISCLHNRVGHARSPSPSIDSPTQSNIAQARLYWIKDSLYTLQEAKRFSTRRRQLCLLIDGEGEWKCSWRRSKSCLSATEQNPILLDKRHHLATLIVAEAHKRVLHNKVNETPTELRSACKQIRGRKFIQKLIHRCVICHYFEGRHCRGILSPPLAEFHHGNIYYVIGIWNDHVRTFTLFVLLGAVSIALVCSNGIAKNKDFFASLSLFWRFPWSREVSGGIHVCIYTGVEWWKCRHTCKAILKSKNCNGIASNLRVDVSSVFVEL